MSEFQLISRLQSRFAAHSVSCSFPAALGIGDDAAVLDVPAGMQLLVSTDTLVSGVHFLADTAPSDIAAKALAVNLSDLAAMGAEPAWFFLAISLPKEDLAWWDGFTDGLLEIAQRHRVQLAGGDTTRGPLSVTITAMGLAERGSELRRSGAKAGELVVISGEPGLAALGLWEELNKEPVSTSARQALLRPQPRLELGRLLIGTATACIDVSDGLAADLGHILDASACGAEIQLGSLPVPLALSELSETDRWNLQLCGGDDYELCFSWRAQAEDQLASLAIQSGVQLSVIGRMATAPGLKLMQPGGLEFVPDRNPYEHFSQ